jgi:hypothetical protein
VFEVEVSNVSAPVEATATLLTARQLKARWGGCSDMKLWRLLQSNPNMPKPIVMGTGPRAHRYFYLHEVIAFERASRREVADATS